jgi:hypothetical protein
MPERTPASNSLYFLYLTHSLARRANTNLFEISSFRTLFIATGVYPLARGRAEMSGRDAGGATLVSPGGASSCYPSAQIKKEGANFAPSSQGKPRNQAVAAKAILWNVEYSASNFFTTGKPSANLATIFSICGYSSRL